MQFAVLIFSDFSLLLAVGALILLIMAELGLPQYGLKNRVINQKKLRKAAIAAGLLFLITVAIKIINPTLA